MKRISVLLIVSFCVLSLNAQNFSTDFTKALRDDNVSRQKEILELWNKSEDRSPDYYIANFNYNFNEASSNVMQITTQRPTSNDAFSLTDSNGGVVGYITEGGIRPDVLKIALNYIDEGISKYPSRLDMRFGKIFALYRAWMWDEYTEEIIKAIDYYEKIDNKWIYPDENADKDFFLTTIQEYQNYLFDEIDFDVYSYEDSMMVLRMQKISNQVLKYYPENVEALNVLGATYFFNNDDVNALAIFLKAEKIAPKDAIILFNIANIYAKQGDKAKAKAYYENIINNCDNDAKQQAEELMKEL